MDPPQDPNQPPADAPDAPDQETMERIRQRRFAKLSKPSAPKSEEGDESTSDPQTPSEAQSRQTPEPKRKINITPAGPASSSSSSAADSLGKRAPATADDRSIGPQPVKKTSMAPAESIEEYSDRTLSGIFRITVDPDRTTDLQGHKLTLLEGVSQELKDEGEPLRLTKNNIDTALLEAASLRPHNAPLLNYLLPCFKRAVRSLASLRDGSGEKKEVLSEAKRLSVSYSLFALTLPDLFNRPQPDSLAHTLLRGYEREDTLCMDFVREAIDRFDEDEQYPAVFADAMAQISRLLSNLTMEGDYRPYLNAMTFYTRFPALLRAVAQHENFLAGNNGPETERQSILGPFFRLSPLQSETLLTYFPNPRSLDRQRAAPAQDTLRTILRVHQDELFAISNSFVRADPDTRSRVLDWFAKSINANHKRRAIQVNSKEVSTDGFMINLTVVLDRFCSPFMDTTFSKIDRIEVDYFRRNPRVNIQDETKLNADQATSDAFYKNTDSKSSNFISEVFFLTLAAHHYGSGAASSKLKQLDREIKHFEKQLKAMEAERVKVQNVPHQLAVLEVQLKRYTDVLERAVASKFAIEGAFMDEKMQELSLRFMRYVAVWLLRLASRSDYMPDKDLKLPLPSPEPEAFSCLPEYALQDVVDNFKFVYRYLPQIMPSAVGNEMIALCVAFMESSQFIKNPYLKQSLVTLLFSSTWPFSHFKKGVLGDQLYGSKFANDYLLHALIKAYIEAESTGANSAFYDKFNTRYEIFQVIRCVWDNDVYKRQLTRESKVNRQFFVQFVNLLLNDATFVLDEALTKFPKIHNIQDEMRAGESAFSQEDWEKKQEELQQLENQATSYMQLANETLSMMKLFTSALSEAFTMPEIVSRLASMLNYNLQTLAGPQMGQLKVENPAKYHFQPKVLLSDFVDIYINLGSSRSFIEAVAADGRSYKPETFEKAHYILTKRSMKDETDLSRLSRLMAKFKEAKEVMDQAEMDLGEIPAEFEDPILGDLMKDPVILPSQHIVDRSTIVQHLLSDPKDPFTRQPMTIDDAISHTELKDKIEAWKAEKMSKIKENKMDTSED